MGWMDMDCIIDRSFRVFSGQVPYRDFFVPTAPLTYFTQAAVWKVLGPSALSMKIYMSVLNGLMAAFLFLFLKNIVRVRPSAIALCLVLFASWSPYSVFPAPWFNSDSSMSACGALLCFCVYHRKGPAYWAFLGGFCCGLSFLFKQNDGAGAVLAGGLFMAIAAFKNRDWKAIVFFAAGAALPSAACALYFGAHGALGNLFDWTVVRAAKGKVGQNPVRFLLGPVITLFGPVCKFLRVIFFAYLAAWAVLEWRARAAGTDSQDTFIDNIPLYRLMLLFSFLFSYFCYLSFAGINFAFYQIFIWVPFLVLWEAFPQGAFFAKAARWVVVAAAAGFVANSLRITLFKHRAFNQPEMKIDYAFKTERLKGAHFYELAGRPLDDLAEYLKSQLAPEENVWIFPEPLSVYFAIGRVSPNPVSAYGETDYEMLQGDQPAVLNSMEGKNVRWAVLQLPILNHHTQHAKFQELMQAMISGYELKEVREPFLIFHRPSDSYRSTPASREKVAALLKANPYFQSGGADL